MKPVLGISMGDPGGIGPEITVKALGHREVYERALPVVIGSGPVLQSALAYCGLKLTLSRIQAPAQAKGEYGIIDYIDPDCLQAHTWRAGEFSGATGHAAFTYVKEGIALAMTGQTDAIVTGPISKEALHLAGYNYAGHTEILGDLTGTAKFAMLLCSHSLRVIHVTTHVALSKACDLITTQRVLDVIRLARRGMEELGFPSPRIGVAGLNPHSSENGLFGHQEQRAIIPAVELAKAEGINAEGPISPDTVFVKALSGKYDIVVAMYHDQGHIPLKLCGFRIDPTTGRFSSVNGINCTIGLPIVRTSVDHGTACDIAGAGIAREDSMLEAIYAAVIMATNRKGGQKTGIGGEEGLC